MRSRDIFTWKISGVGGQGQQAAGATFAKACARGGLHTFTSSEFPSVIRGGHGTTQVSVGPRSITAPRQTVNLLVALDGASITMHERELSHDGAIIFDRSAIAGLPAHPRGAMLLPLPLPTLLQEAGAPALAGNVIAVGASFGLLRFSQAILESAIANQFAVKGKETVAMNVRAAKVGWAYAVRHNATDHYRYQLGETSVHRPAVILNGNDAMSLGLAAAGCQLYVAYPMSPATGILHTLAAWAEKMNLMVRQPEDEISGIHVAIGAMHAGTRAAIATSGGGFALMNEAVALAAMTETPLVCIVSSRPGPATGLPTWTEQGDLQYVVHCGHGEILRVVLTPGDPQEAYLAAAHAFNLAEIFQLPVFILLDKFLSDSVVSLPDFSLEQPEIQRGKILNAAALAGKEFQRYAFTPDGVSPRSLPGTAGGIFLANSDEHDETGASLEAFGRGADTRRRMVDKRSSKLRSLVTALPKPVRFGPARATLTLVGWGSTKGPVLEALHDLPYVNYVHLPAVWPLPRHEIEQLTAHADHVVTIENNSTGQFARLLRAETGMVPHHQILKYTGQQFFPEEVVEQVKEVL